MRVKEVWKMWKPAYTTITGINTITTIPAIYISNLGNVKGREKSIIGNGYLRISYKNKYYKIHRLVAELFIPNPENKPEVDHINRNRNDNRVCNLRWVTRVENCRNTSTNKKIKCKETGIEYNCIAEIPGYDKNINTHFSRNIQHGWAIQGYHYEYIN